MTWDEMKAEKRQRAKEKSERRTHFLALKAKAAKGDSVAGIVLGRITAGPRNTTATVGKTTYNVNENGTYRRVKDV